MPTEADGGPVAVVLAPAGRHDSTLLQDASGQVIVGPPDPVSGPTRHPCVAGRSPSPAPLDKAFDGAPSEAAARGFGYQPRVRRAGEEKPDKTGRKRHTARRRVVERTIGWLNRGRGIPARYEAKAEHYRGAVQLARAVLWCRRRHRLTT